MAQFRIVPEESEIYAQARSNVHPIEIRSHGVGGTIEVGVESGAIVPSDAARATIEVTAEELRSGIELYDAEIHRMIEVRKFRTIRAELLEIHDIGEGRYRVLGTLGFHGVTREVECEVGVSVVDGGAAIEIEGSHVIDMRHYKLDPPKVLMLEVEPEVTLSAKLRAVRV